MSAPVFRIVTCSDTRSKAEDTAGAALESLIAEEGWECAGRVVVKDERADIAAAIVEACEAPGTDIVLTCGGSGLSPRDVTPEATRDVCDREVLGIAEAMRAHSLGITPFAMLSRATCMQRGTVLVVNLPGSKKAACENWEGIVAALPHAVDMMAGHHHGEHHRHGGHHRCDGTGPHHGEHHHGSHRHDASHEGRKGHAACSHTGGAREDGN